MTPLLVCNSADPAAAPPPPGVERAFGHCSDCGRDIHWIVSRATTTVSSRLVCGRCARERIGHPQVFRNR